MDEFYEITPSLDNYWRGIILFGRNVASYKFALAKSLFDLSQNQNDLVTLDELAVPFSHHICTHLEKVDKQGTSSSSKFLNTCRDFNSGKITQEDLHIATVRLGFNNVIDAFHVVNQGEIPKRFFIDERTENKGIRLTDNLLNLFSESLNKDLSQEVEARWRLVETAWELNISRNLIQVDYDETSQQLFTTSQNRRTTITSCRDSLNGYQKGKCFYCYENITILPGDENLADVDHFFPHILKDHMVSNIDGVWNLVLACKDCNRGDSGKFARVPSTALLQRLHRRNEYLINSHHPLKETLIAQTGKAEQNRKGFLQQNYNTAKRILVHSWEPTPKGSKIF